MDEMSGPRTQKVSLKEKLFKKRGKISEKSSVGQNKSPIKRFFRKKWVRGLITLVVVAAIGFTAYARFFSSSTRAGGEKTTRTATVERQTIQSALSSSGTLAALDTYNITSLVSGEVIAADFEEGDQVEKGDVLYRVDTDSIDSRITSAETSLERAKKKYQTALEDYDEAAEKYASLNYASTMTGYIKALYVEAGDTVQNGTQIAEIYDDRIMVLKVPFLSSAVSGISVGDTAQVQVLETYETLKGKVTSVSSLEQTQSGGSIVRMVSIQVENPGGLSTDNTGAASVNGINCSGEGTFTALVDKTLTADRTAEISSMAVEEGSYVEAGTTLFVMDSDSVEEQLENLKTSLGNAEESLEDAQTSLEDEQDNLADYEITAPISGTVIVKNVKAGDTLNSNSNNSTTLASIYDMSALTFEMSVDELDVLNVEVGQKVEVTADAFEDQTFSGTVTNVSLVNSTSNGVTQYPVTVLMEEVGDLLPGMNVTGKIIIDEAENALAIPAQALMRGNVVYVQDDSVKEADGNVPAGFRSVEVETGLISEDYVEILSGLSEGDVVYIDPTTSSETTMAGMMGGMPGGMQGGGMQGGGMPTGGGGAPGGGPGGGF